MIDRFSQEVHQRLACFGLPGTDMRDLIDWKNFIEQITCIEYLDKKNGDGRDGQLQTISKLMSNLVLHGFQQKWEVRKGKLEDIIFDGADIDGNQPALLILEKGRPATMKYN